MKNLLLTLSILFAAYTAGIAQCSASWMGWTDANYGASFVDSSGTDPNLTTYHWDFGDGSTSSAQNPTHQYSNPGWHTICFTINVSGSLCQDTKCDSLYVGQQSSSCQSGFSYTNTPNGNHAFAFNNTSQASGGAVAYEWVFGDGSSSTQANPTHTYSNTGTYSVCLRVTVSINGNVICLDDHCTTLTVTNVPPTCSALFGFQSTGLTAYFTGPANYAQSWNFGDGQATNATNPTHIYAASGTYNVCLIVLDSATLCTDTYCTDVTVSGTSATCDATFNATPTGITNLGYSFAEAIPNGAPFSSHVWSFGDGTIDSTASPVHEFPFAGQFPVCHTITQYDANHNLLCSNTRCDSITVTPAFSCYAYFTSSYASNDMLTLAFHNASTGQNTLTYFWDFGDSTTSTQQAPSHVYAQAGSYNVCLTVTESSGGAVNCTDTYCFTTQAGGPIGGSTLQGAVWTDSTSGWNEADVYLIQYDSVSQTLTAVDTVQTVWGRFAFTGVAPGNYLIKAALVPSAPRFNDYLPTYYQNVLFWYDAATIVVPIFNQPHYNIFPLTGTNPSGPGFVGGNVNQGANKQATGDPIEGVQVMLLNMDNTPVQYTYSDANGSFGFQNVAYGTYKVYAEVVGKPTFPAIVTLSSTKESVTDVAVVIEEEGVYNAITEVEVTYLNGTNFYPNPVAALGNLVFNANETGTVKVQVINMLGQTVAMQETNVTPGSQHLTVDMANHQAGIYLLTISFNNHVAAHLRFIKD